MVDQVDVPNLSVESVKVPTGPVTRARSKKFKESHQTLVRAIQDQFGPYQMHRRCWTCLE